MAALWSSSPTLQWAPMDAETLTTLTGIIHEGPSPPTPAAAHNLSCALHALAALCTRREEARRAVLDRKVAPILLRAIESTDASVRCADAGEGVAGIVTRGSGAHDHFVASLG